MRKWNHYTNVWEETEPHDSRLSMPPDPNRKLDAYEYLPDWLRIAIAFVVLSILLVFLVIAIRCAS